MAGEEEFQIRFTDEDLKVWVEAMMKAYFGRAYREFASKFSWRKRV
jgi:hypothetical protein